MRKKKCIGFIILLLVLLLGLSSNSYAWTWDDLINYAQQIIEKNEAPTNIIYTANVLKNRQAVLKQQIQAQWGSTDYFTSFIMTNNNSTANSGSLYLYMYNNTVNISIDANQHITFPRAYYLQFSNGNQYPNWFNKGNNESTSVLNVNNCFGLVETETDLYDSSYYLQNKYDTGMEFVPTPTEKVNYSDYQNVNVLRVNYSNIWQDLGVLDKINENHNYYTFVWYDSNGSILYKLNWTPTIVDNLEENNLLLTGRYKVLYVRTRLLYKNNIYTLGVYSSDIDYEISNAKDSQVFTYIVLNDNAVVSGDTILNFGSGDNYTNQDSTNDLINSNNDNTQAIIGALTDTTIPSGDEPTLQDLPVVDFNFEIGDESGDFFTWVLTEFVNVLNSNENVSIDIPIYNTHHYVPSNFWVLDIEPLRTFISARLVVYCWCSFLKVYS